jgi:glutamine synthetase
MTFEPNHLRWVRLTFVDVFGTINSMMLPASRLDDAFEHGIVFDGSALEGQARHFESNMRLWPDHETLRDLGNGFGRVVCDVRTPAGVAWPGDPRTALQLIADQADSIGAEITYSAELEFYLLDAHGEPVDQGGYFDTVTGPGPEVVTLTGDLLRERGVEVLSCHHEAGPGQYELDIAPLAPLALADAIVLAKETIRDVSYRSDLRVTFMPLPFGERPGSGLHLHQRAPELLKEDGQLTAAGHGFVAGQLDHAAGLCALAAPTVNSYRRLHAGPEAPSAAIWSHASRGALVRVTTDLEREASIEYRGADPTSNPYLLLAGLIACGIAGIDDELDPGPPTDESIGGFDPTTTTQRLVVLPRSLDEALDSLQADDVLVDTFDSVLLSRLVDGRRVEAEDYRATVSAWERDRYSSDA